MISLLKNTIEIALFSSLMIVIVLIIRFIFNDKLNIKIMSLLWILVITRLLVPITVESPIHIVSISTAIPSQSLISSIFNLSDITAENSYTETSEQTNPYGDNKESSSQTPEANTSFTYRIKSFFNQITILDILAVIWLIGILIMLIIKGTALYSFNNKISESRKISNSEMTKMINDNRIKMKLKRSIAVYECDYIDAPVTIGIFKPKILIPVGFITTIKKEMQSMIILHEICHIKNLDVVKNYVWLMVRIIYWFNPLVPYAYKRYIEDIELLCDTIILDKFSEGKSYLYSQSLIDAVKLSKGEIAIPIALSFCEDRSNLRKRVEYMIKPTKKRKSASIITLCIALVMVFACFSTACLPKNTVSVNEVNSTAEIQHIEYEIEPTDNVKIHINADVTIPENISLVSVEPANISAKQLENFVDYVLGDTPVYYKDGDYIDKRHEIGMEYDGKIVPLGEDRRTFTELSAYTSDNKESNIRLDQSPQKLSSYLSYYRSSGEPYSSEWHTYDGTYIENMEKSYDECLEIAETLIEKLVGKNNNLKLYDSLSNSGGEVQPFYMFWFYNEYNGIPATLHGSFLPSDFHFGIDLHTIGAESIRVYVNDDGVFRFNWRDHQKEIGVVEKNVELLDFDKINKNFKDYCMNQSEWILNGLPNPDDITSVEININSIELNVMSLSKDGDSDTYVMTPVWNFIGEVTYVRNTDVSESKFFNKICIATINALDGTVFN